MAKKITLEYGYQPDFSSVGICSVQKDYRICWLINQHMGMSLTRAADFNGSALPETSVGLFQDDAQDKQSNPEGHAVFIQYDQNKRSCLSLIANKSPGGCLFPEPRNLDYLLVIKKPGLIYEVSLLVEALQKIPQVTLAFPADRPIGKSATDFYFDFELYLIRQSIH